MIKGFNFEGQLSSADVDALIYNEMLDKNDGIIKGMNLSNTSDTITISEGICCALGRQIAVVGSEKVTVAVTSTTNYCVLVIEIDKTKESSNSSFEQVSFKVLTSTASYTSVTQQDINYEGDGTIYQLELARFKLGLTGITEFQDTRKFINFNNILSEANKKTESLIQQIKTELESVEDGSIYVLKEEGKGLSTNDYTTEEKTELQNVKTLSNSNALDIKTLQAEIIKKQKTISYGTSTPSRWK